MGTIVVPKIFSVASFDGKAFKCHITCLIMESWQNLTILWSLMFSWIFRKSKICFCYALKSCKNIKLQNIVRFCKDFIIRLWHGIWTLVHQSLQHKMFWVPQWYPYYRKIFLIHLNYWIENLSMELTNVTLQANVVPNGTQKNFIRKMETLSFPALCQSSV